MKNWSQRLKCFLVVWLTMISCICARSQDFNKMGINKDFLKLIYPGTEGLKMSANTDYRLLNLTSNAVFNYKNDGAIIVIPSNIYYTQSGIMCKGEWQLEKATHIPFRFRLGSLADCNALEGKH